MNGTAFLPCPGLRGAHRQTIGAWLLGSGARPDWQHERLELDDGDFVDLAHLPGRNGYRICLFHGLEGCLHSHYVGGLAIRLQARGYAVTFMHFRGCSGVPNRLPRAYHSGDIDDIEALFQDLQKRRPHERLAAVGFSLGGNALLKYLGERGDGALLEAAAAVSVPFDLAACAARIDHGPSRIYQYNLVRHMKRSTHARVRYLHQSGSHLPVDLAHMDRCRSFREFDDCVTAPLHGFADADDYYARASSAPWLPAIARPALLVQALDDPFVGPGPIPGPNEIGTSTERAISAHGGHVGFLAAGQGPRPVRWLDHYLPGWLGRTLTETTSATTARA